MLEPHEITIYDEQNPRDQVTFRNLDAPCFSCGRPYRLMVGADIYPCWPLHGGDLNSDTIKVRATSSGLFEVVD